MSEEPTPSRLMFLLVSIVWILFLIGILGQAPRPVDNLQKEGEPKANDIQEVIQ